MSLLRPHQVIGYTVARWLISKREPERRSGRTFVLAAAHLAESVQSGVSKIWDHGRIDGLNPPWKWVEAEVLNVARLLGLEIDYKGGVLRRVDDGKSDPFSILTGEEEMIIVSFRAFVQHMAFSLDYSEEEILKMVYSFLRDEVVEGVHSA